MTSSFSFTANSGLLCHRCRAQGGTNAPDAHAHLCSLNRDLYLVRVFTVEQLFSQRNSIVGGFTLPRVFVEPDFTNMPCPVEYIASTPANCLKISQGVCKSGPYYIFLYSTGRQVISFYKVNGDRISSRELTPVSSLAVYFNKIQASNSVPSVSNPGGLVETDTPSD